MERAMNHVTPDSGFQAARLTVRLDAITANWRTMQRLAGTAVAAGVVKANAYGLGADKVAPALAAAGCETFFVARLEEGVALRKLCRQARIFTLDGAPADAVPALLSYKLVPVLGSLADVAVWSAVAGERTLDAALHVDTGMNRLGLPGEELSLLAAEQVRRLKGVNLVLVMSHLACADDAHDAMNAAQLARFRAALALLPPAPASLAASAGVLLGKDYHFDLVRPGIGLTGANPMKDGENPFRAAAVLAARVLQVRRIDKGESVGYAATFRAGKPTMLATVAIGYADGIPRAASNRGAAAFRGARAPIVGRVSMDLVTLDISDMVEQPRVGDWVELVGDTITLDDAATAAGTNAYEILTSLSRRVPRHYPHEAP
jgi:alanine racemase